MKKTATAAAGDREVTVDRRREDRRATGQDAKQTTGTERRKKPRRRHIDPTTCERDYSQDEIDFMQAMDAYKRSSGRMFPTCSEVLEVVRSLGYYRLSDDQLAVLKAEAWGGDEPRSEATDEQEVLVEA